MIWRGVPSCAAIRSLPNPWLASSTIFARITSRYRDVYSLQRLSNSACSCSVSWITNGLRLGMVVPPERKGPRHAVTSRPKIRHRIYETQYEETSPYLPLASASEALPPLLDTALL